MIKILEIIEKNTVTVQQPRFRPRFSLGRAYPALLEENTHSFPVFFLFSAQNFSFIHPCNPLLKHIITSKQPPSLPQSANFPRHPPNVFCPPPLLLFLFPPAFFLVSRFQYTFQSVRDSLSLSHFLCIFCLFIWQLGDGRGSRAEHVISPYSKWIVSVYVRYIYPFLIWRLFPFEFVNFAALI